MIKPWGKRCPNCGGKLHYEDCLVFVFAQCSKDSRHRYARDYEGYGKMTAPGEGQAPYKPTLADDMLEVEAKADHIRKRLEAQ